MNAMNVDENLQARILTFVVREFLDSKRATPRRDLILAFETEDVSTALANLTNHSLLRRKDNVFPEHYLPSAASFHFCDDEQLRTTARAATTAVLHALRRMFKTNPSDKSYEFAELEREVRALYPDSNFDEATLKLGLYLATDLNVLQSRQMNPPDDAEIVRFQIAEGIITAHRNLDTAWDVLATWYKPLQVEPTSPSDLFAAVGAFPPQDHQNQVYLPAGSQHDAYVELRKIVQFAKSDMLIVDPYVDGTLWELLTNVYPTVKLRILTQQMKKDFRLEARKFAAQHGNAIEIRTTSQYHDRFIVEDNQRCWHIGASIKDAGNKAFAFSELLRTELVTFVISDVENEWTAASVVVL
jgi:hypothetical protein